MVINKNKILIIGAGYIGSAMALHFSLRKSTVFLWDNDQRVRSHWQNGQLPFQDDDLVKAFAKVKKNKNVPLLLSDLSQNLKINDVLICVGTPSKNGQYQLDDLIESFGLAAEFLQRNGGGRIYIRSTLPPGTCRQRLLPLLSEKSYGKQPKNHINVIYFPEFLREGTALEDMQKSDFYIFGTDGVKNPKSLAAFFGVNPKKSHLTSFETAEVLKISCNAFHALKVVFANEIGRIAKASNADVDQLAELFCSDKRLNISPAYLKPGFAFGGPCLEKDTAGIISQPALKNQNFPLLANINKSNESHLSALYDQIISLCGGSDILGIIGTSFKANSKDGRNSPVTALVDKLKQSHKISVISSTDFRMPKNAKEFISTCDVLVLGSTDFQKKEVDLIIKSGKKVIDLRLSFSNSTQFAKYKNYIRLI